VSSSVTLFSVGLEVHPSSSRTLHDSDLDERLTVFPSTKQKSYRSRSRSPSGPSIVEAAIKPALICFAFDTFLNRHMCTHDSSDGMCGRVYDSMTGYQV
jgi:hypothetical protein